MAASSVVFVFLAALALVSAGKHDIYIGYSVHGVELRDRSDLQLLHDLEVKLNLDIWQHGSPGIVDALVMVSPDNSAAFLDDLDASGLKHYLHLPDVAKNLEEHDEMMAQWRRNRGNRIVPFEDYPRFDEVNRYLEYIAEQYSDIVTLVDAGKSFEGRDIKYLKISTTGFSDTSKPIYFMDAMIHAREWVTTPVALYSIHRLVEELRDQDKDLLEDTDWIVLPVVNPDGYEHSHTDVRLWRRTRSFNPDVSETCFGVDGNRNFDVAFNTDGVSSNPCSDIYPGHEPFSEVETGYVRDILHEYLDRIQVYMNIHSHGNWILYSYGNRTLPDNVAHLHFVGSVMGSTIDALKLPQANYYRVGNSAFLLYPTSGSAQDYAQSVGVPFSYTLELPGYGYMFSVPPEFISQINEETWAGIAASARLARIYYDARR